MRKRQQPSIQLAALKKLLDGITSVDELSRVTGSADGAGAPKPAQPGAAPGAAAPKPTGPAPKAPATPAR